ncbi:Fe-S oxidoreductase [Anaeromyxobacter sp. K]|uniref:anti-sigma factor family protein n=1 Tax=Anaeromyxobacter sp. (strain K) TaxID=447217 RepID=UPI00015F9C37|nr:zf-HC2 domain-containing protein [Anaeromyxobacter sp. K]ACG71484.1 Fe-S oxidoreductase [Anaeromyxobacter sp. K]
MSDERFHERLGARLHDAILEHAYGELPAGEARALERHLEACDACRAELGRIRGTRALMSGLEEAPAPERGEAVLLAAAREAAGARGRRRRLPAWTWGAALSAAALVAVGAVSYRLLALHPGPALRDDPEALLGRAAAPAPQAATEAATPAAPEAPAAAAAPAAGPDDVRAERTRPAAPPAPERRREPPPRLGAAKSAPAAAPSAVRAGEPEADAPVAPRTFLAPAPAQAPAPSPSTAERTFAPPTPAPTTERTVAPPPPAPSPSTAERTFAPPAPETAPAPKSTPAPKPTPAPAPRALRAEATEAAPAAAGSAPAAALEAVPAPEHAPGARRAATAARGQDQDAAAAPAGSDALARWRALRQAGALRGEVVTFTDCDGEAWRKVERDAQGRVVRYVRHGRLAGRAFEADLYYGEDGALALVRYREEGGPWREARPPGTDGAIPEAALRPARAADARADAPPRCGP